jgi:peptidoglycan/LPS O-acetylase OafA/YrhL
LQSSTGSHFAVLDGIRGVAILLVVASHTFYTNPSRGLVAQAAAYVFKAGWMGVPIFFVLSGFLISLPLFQGREANPQFWYPAGYARRRLAKIIPPFYLSILLFLGFYWWRFQDPAYFTSAWQWATGLANFQSIPVPFNLSYWSLIVEAHFYLVLPLLFWLTRGASVRRTTIFLFCLLLIIPLLVRHAVWPAGLYVLSADSGDLRREILLKLTRFPAQLDYFAWGVVFAGVYVPLVRARDLLRPLSVFGYAGLLLLGLSLLCWGYWAELFLIQSEPTRWSIEIAHLLPGVAAFLLLFLVFDRECWAARWLSVRWLRFVGLVSFEWFLFHGPIVNWFHEIYGPSQGSLLAYAWRTVVPLLLTFGFSVVIYRWFSLPILTRVRNGLKSASAAS